MWLRNQALDHRLRLHFPLPFSAAYSCADGAFYVNRRPPGELRREAGSGEVELPTYPMRSFVDAADERRGLALVTDGLHEYELLAGKELAVTLLRSVGWLSRDDLAYRVGHAGPALATPSAQELGEHSYRFGLVFHRGDWESGGVWRAAEELLLPFRVVGPDPGLALPGPLAGGMTGQNQGALPVHQSIDLEPPSIQMTALIPRPEGYDIRLLNASDRPHRARVAIQPLPVAVSAVRLVGEQRTAPAMIDGRYELGLRPWEIATLRVRP
jgi:alpha-mannosidase